MNRKIAKYAILQTTASDRHRIPFIRQKKLYADEYEMVVCRELPYTYSRDDSLAVASNLVRDFRLGTEGARKLLQDMPYGISDTNILLINDGLGTTRAYFSDIKGKVTEFPLFQDFAEKFNPRMEVGMTAEAERRRILELSPLFSQNASMTRAMSDRVGTLLGYQNPAKKFMKKDCECDIEEEREV